MTFQKVNPKQSFPEMEEAILAFWRENDTFQKSIENRPEDKPYRFYDGPPFITGMPHYGSLLSSIVKDIVPRYHTMQGKRIERKWGWDCHGLPIEEKVQKKLGVTSSKEIEENVGIKKFIEECYTYTKETSAEWDWYIEHIGRWVDTDNAYRTMDQDYMESVMWVFKTMWDKGMIYKGQRVSLYSWKLSTPISNFEVAMDDSYEEVSDPAITVMFPITSSQPSPSEEKELATNTPLSSKGEGLGVREGDFILAWTTTPWTIPAHMSMALNSKLAYSRVLSEDKYYVLATARVETVFKGKEYEIIESFMGKDLIGLAYEAPFSYYQGKVDPEKNHRILDADFITDTDGTGIGHQAPEFGDVDFQLAQKEGVHISAALDNAGKYTEEISDYEGLHYREANDVISEKLKEMGRLFKKESINHRVAMCPRSGTPLIYKAQDSWFINIQDMKDKLIAENEGINWQPNHLKHGQFLKSMESAPDWCISRTRYWGTPMPIWKDSRDNLKILGSKKEIFEANKPFGQLEERDGTFFFKTGEFAGKELDLHRPFIDDVLAVNTENFVAKKVLGIHGFKRTDEVIDFFNAAKYNLEKENITITIPEFEKGSSIDYKNWETILDGLNFSEYDTIVAHSLGTRVISEYLLAKNITNVKRLILVSPSNSGTRTDGTARPEIVEFFKKFENRDLFKLQKLVDEVITIHSKDDTAVPFSEGRFIAEEIGASFIEVNGYGHFNLTESPLIEGIIKHGEPLVRTPEVLDVWMDSGSMPYAQEHYPFENEEKMKASYPADFIVEYIGQVRAWFYVMHVVGVAVFDQRSFTNVITTGIVMGSDGKKMSKNLGNYPDPKETIQKYGADAVRFYMANSPLLTGGNMDFKEEGILEVVKKVILPLWNTYSFFTTYANIDNFEPTKGAVYFVRHGETDNNKNRIVNGGNDDVDINEAGIEQAHETGKMLQARNLGIQKIVCSPMLRAKHTAEIIKSYLGEDIEIEFSNGLREMDYGEFKGKSLTKIAEENDMENNFDKVWQHVFQNSAETVTDFVTRIESAFDTIHEKNKDEHILVVAHSGTFKAHKTAQKFETSDYYQGFRQQTNVKNASVSKLHLGKPNPLDTWIISETNKLVSDVEAGMENYEVTDATRPIVKFMDQLTNWYIRRSRKRFWKSENDGDKMEAYETLYEVLVKISQVVAPFMPFVTEEIYKNLTGQESVHLTDFPKADASLIDEKLNADMDLCQKIINLGLSLRENHKIRVRQPLKSISIGEKLDDYYKNIIKEELNLKEVLEVNSSSIAKKICKPNGRLIGPKFGKDVKQIMTEAKSGNFEEIDENTVQVGDFVLEGDDFEMAFMTQGDDDNIESGFGMVIAMNLEITPELETEGYARDIVRHIQEARKEAGYEVDDRISINIIVDNLEAILASYDIATETLSTIDNSLSSGDLEKEIELGDMTAKIILKK